MRLARLARFPRRRPLVTRLCREALRNRALALDDQQVHVCHLRDDRVIEVWQYVGDGEAAAAFWA